MKKKYFYITTPIFYPNGKLHLGHAYTLSLADILVRYKKIKKYITYFQTGSDDHGEKISRVAAEKKITPQNLVDKNSFYFKELWKKMNISEDYFFMRTSYSYHVEKVQEIFKKLLLSGDIYLGKYKGNYCITCEDYVLNSETCIFCYSSLISIEEEAYFLKINKYKDFLKEHYEKNKKFLLPKSSLKELFKNFLQKNEIPDLCITRKSFGWGVGVPDHPEMTIYVWFDALCNYLTSENGEKFFSRKEDDFEIIQIIGKDIVRFHAIYWPIILTSLKKNIPNKIISHGWILNSGEKMSKSKGNIINPLEIIEEYGSDTLRAYFFLRINLYQDGFLNKKLLSEFYKDFFLNNLGNFFSRLFKMIEIFCDNFVPNLSTITDKEIKKKFDEVILCVKNYDLMMENYQLTKAFNEIEKILKISNKVISEFSPWILFEKKNFALLNQILIFLVNNIKIIAFLLSPLTPLSSEIIFSYLEIDLKNIDFSNFFNFSDILGKKLKKMNNYHLFKK